MKFRGLLLFLIVAAFPTWAQTCLLSQIKELDQSTTGPGCAVLTQQEQMQLMACLTYVNGGMIKPEQPVTFPIPLKQAREICAGYGGRSMTIIINQGPFSESLDKSLLQKMNDEQVKNLNSCVERSHCSGTGFVAAFSRGVPYDLSMKYSTCVAKNSCRSSAFSFLIERNGDFAQAFMYSECVANDQCSSSSFTWAIGRNLSFAQSLEYSQCVSRNKCSSSSFQWLMEKGGGNFDQSLNYSQCVSNDNCSSSALQWKVDADKTLNFDDAMELSQCVSKNRCSLLQYQRAYTRLNGNHAQAMSLARD